MKQFSTFASPEPSPFSLNAFMMGEWHYPLQVHPLLLSTPHLSPGAKLFYAALIQYHYPTRNEAIDHPEVLCEILGCTPDQARRWFNELKRTRINHCRPPDALLKRDCDPDDYDRDPVPRLRFVEETPEPVGRQGFIYVLRAGDVYKIGKTKRYSERIATHQASSPLEIVEVMSAKVHSYDQVEMALHKRFKAKEVRCEWFRLDEGDLEEIREALDDAKA